MLCQTCGQTGTFARKHKVCNTCRAAQNRVRSSESLDAYLSLLLTNAKVRARRKQVECDLTQKQILDLWKKQKGRCAVSGIPMTHVVGEKFPREFNVSLDRINAGGPYTKNNVQLVCSRINQMRGNLDIPALRWWVKTLYEHMEP